MFTLPQSSLDPVISQINSSQTVYVVIGADPTYDMIASAIAVSEAVLAMNKAVHVVCPTPMLVEFNRILHVDRVKNTIGNKDLVISLPYEKNKVEKVSYSISEDGTRFNLIISPLKGVDPLNSEGVSFEYSGAHADMLLLIGVENTNDLGFFYELEKSFFDNTFSVVINYSQSSYMARHQLLIGEASSFSEGVIPVLSALNFSLSSELATSLLEGIFSESKQLSSAETTADTYEAVAMLMKQGGVRPELKPSLSDPLQGTVQPYSSMGIGDAQQTANWFPEQGAPSYVAPTQQVSAEEFANLLSQNAAASGMRSNLSNTISTEDQIIDEPEFIDATQSELEADQQQYVEEEIDTPVLSNAAPYDKNTNNIQDGEVVHQQTSFVSAITERVKRARKAAAAKKRRVQGGTVGQIHRVTTPVSPSTQPSQHIPSDSSSKV